MQGAFPPGGGDSELLDPSKALFCRELLTLTELLAENKPGPEEAENRGWEGVLLLWEMRMV